MLYQFVGSETKICQAFGIKDQKFGYENGISDETRYLVMTLKLWSRVSDNSS